MAQELLTLTDKVSQKRNVFGTFPTTIAIRVWSQPYSVDMIQTVKGKICKLINLPFYLVGQIPHILKNI